MLLIFLLLSLAASSLHAQTPQPLPPHAEAQPQPAPATPRLTPRPGEVYKQLMRPLDEVRSSLDNWSSAELAALAAGIKRAQEYCKQVPATSVSGDDLYQLARVCSVGQQWNDADAAANAYIKSASQPYQAHAYALRINALLNLKDTAMAVEVARSMMRAVPYDATVDQAMAYLIHYLAMSMDDAATPLAAERQPFLLAALRTGSGLKEQPGDAVIGSAALYDEGLALAFLERYAAKDGDARQTVAALDAALASVPAANIDDPSNIEQARQQYALLGQRLPPIEILHYVTGLPRPRINPSYGSATVLFVFPEWCTQCRKMMPAMKAFLGRNAADGVHAYGVLALDPDQAATDPFKSEAFKDLLETPTLTTPAATLTLLRAESFPFAVITDGDGRIRFVGAVPVNALDAGGYVETFLAKNVQKNAAPPSQSAPR